MWRTWSPHRDFFSSFLPSFLHACTHGPSSPNCCAPPSPRLTVVPHPPLVVCRYEVQDLRVIDILPQMVALSESYFQVYELKRGAGGGGDAGAGGQVSAPGVPGRVPAPSGQAVPEPSGRAEAGVGAGSGAGHGQGRLAPPPGPPPAAAVSQMQAHMDLPLAPPTQPPPASTANGE